MPEQENGHAQPITPAWGFIAQHLSVLIIQQLHTLAGMGMIPAGVAIRGSCPSEDVLRIELKLPSPIVTPKIVR